MGSVALMLSPGCAGLSHGSAGYAFPSHFDVTQVVTVAPERGETREFVGSVRRAGGDFVVTLFDPVFEVPLLTASYRAGRVTEETHAPGLESGQGRRLVELLRDLYGQHYSVVDDGGTAVGTDDASYRLVGIPGPGSSCRFPLAIEILPRKGMGPRVSVRTVDVACRAAVPGR